MSLHGECKVLLKTLVNSSHIYILIQRHTFWNFIECKTYGCLTKAPSSSSVSPLAVMQMDDDLPVHLNVLISMFKQSWHVKSTKNILMVLTLDVMVVHKFSYWRRPYANLLVTVYSVVGEGLGEVTWTNKWLISTKERGLIFSFW